MTVEITRDEAKEIALVLRHFYDASTEHPNTTAEHLAILAIVIAKLQDGLKMGSTPWESPAQYENVS